MALHGGGGGGGIATLGDIGNYTVSDSAPSSPSDGDFWFDSTNDIEFKYDGTRWLSTHTETVALENIANFPPYNAATETWRAAQPWAGIYAVWVEHISVGTHNTAAPASNYYTFQLAYQDTSGATNLGSSFNNSGDTANQFTPHTQSIGASAPSTAALFRLTATETGAVTMHVYATMTYRLIGS